MTPFCRSLYREHAQKWKALKIMNFPVIFIQIAQADNINSGDIIVHKYRVSI